jgi:hypothetical protein
MRRKQAVVSSFGGTRTAGRLTVVPMVGVLKAGSARKSRARRCFHEFKREWKAAHVKQQISFIRKLDLPPH